MTTSPTAYTMVLPVLHYRIDANRVAVESAFSEHLRMMRSHCGDAVDRLVVASPEMPARDYERLKQSLAVIDEPSERIYFAGVFPMEAARTVAGKLRLVFPMARSILRLAKESQCVHSGLSWDPLMPFEFLSILFATMLKRRTVFVVDIDYRNSAWMSYRSRHWRLKNYLACRYIYDPPRSLQIWLAVRWCSLVLLKGRKMAADFGQGRPNVKAFLDASHSKSHVIGPDWLEAKLKTLRDPQAPLRLVYFGRLTAYKGIDRCLKAASAARQAGANLTFDVIGGGEQDNALKQLAHDLGADDWVTFHGPLPFDRKFFETLYTFHLLLAAPLREDTPRSALDAMAAGIPYLAFDTYYYRELLESGAGRTIPWLDVDAMALAMKRLAENREEVAAMVENAVRYAELNTQEIWLDRRMEWTLKSATEGSA